MRTLATLLEAASRRSATEVLLESGQRVIVTTARGTEAEPDKLLASELFDMIIAAVDDAQQIELAVGNPVQFRVEADGTWTVAAEPTADGIAVRARREGVGFPVDEVAIDLSEPAVADSSPAGADFEVDFEPRFSASEAVPPRPRARTRLPDLDVQALDAPALDVEPPQTPAQSAPHESGTWSLADDDDDFGAFDEPIPSRKPLSSASITTAVVRHPTGPLPRSPSASGSHPRLTVGGQVGPISAIGVPDDDDDDFGDDPFEPFTGDTPPRRGVTVAITPTREIRVAEPEIPEVSIKPEPPAPVPAPVPAMAMAAPARRPAEMPTRRELPPAEPPQTPTQRELPVQTMPEPRREAVERPELGSLARSVPEGTLVFVQEHGLADLLAESFAAPSTTVDDQSHAEEAWARIRGLSAGAIVIIRREDPSVLLGWILRRLEEGCRVFVETRARTLDGARRTLLGVAASDRAERWLDSKVALVIEPSETGPRVRQGP